MKIPNPPRKKLLQDFILQVSQRHVGNLSHFESLASEAVVMGLESLLWVIGYCLNFRVDPWCLSLVLASSNPLRVLQQALILSSRPLVFQVLQGLNMLAYLD